eukprot:scaffold56415_cov59-Phaeocystis_antarctica.AAC.2
MLSVPRNARVVALGERTLLLLVDTLFHAVALRELARGVDLVGVRQQGRHETLERGEAIGAEQPPLELAQVRRALDAKGGHPRSLGHAVYGRVVVVREVHVLDALPVDAVEEGLLTLEAAQAVVSLLLELCVRAVDHHLARGGDVGHLEQAHQWRHRHTVDHDREHHHEQRHRHRHKRLVAAVERFDLVTRDIRHENKTLAPHGGVIDRVLDDEGEREADRATQSTPPHDHRVPPRGARAHALEEREGDEDGEAAREENDGVDQDDLWVDLEDLLRGAVDEQHAELGAGDGEDDRVEDMRDHLIELVQKVEDLGRDVCPVVVDVQSHDHHADDGGGAADELAQPEAQVRHGQHHRTLDSQLVVQEAASENGELAARQPEDDAEEEHLREDAEELREIAAHRYISTFYLARLHPGRSVGGDGVPDDVAHPYEEHDRAAVVEQRLALDERAQGLRGTQLLEQRHYGDGVGGRLDDADEPAREKLPVREACGWVRVRVGVKIRVRSGFDRGEDHRRESHREDLELLLEEEAHVDAEGGALEEERGQEDDEHHVGIDAGEAEHVPHQVAPGRPELIGAQHPFLRVGDALHQHVAHLEGPVEIIETVAARRVCVAVSARARLAAVSFLPLDAEGIFVEAGADEAVPPGPVDAFDCVAVLIVRRGVPPA